MKFIHKPHWINLELIKKQFCIKVTMSSCSDSDQGSTESVSMLKMLSSLLVSMAVSLSVSEASKSANMALASSRVTWAEVVLWNVLVVLSSLLRTESELGVQYEVEEESDILDLSQLTACCHLAGSWSSLSLTTELLEEAVTRHLTAWYALQLSLVWHVLIRFRRPSSITSVSLSFWSGSLIHWNRIILWILSSRNAS